LQHAKLTAFGPHASQKIRSTKIATYVNFSKRKPPSFPSSQKLGSARSSRRFGISEDENLSLISETVAYLKKHGRESGLRREHFFDGYIHNREYCPENAQSRSRRRRRRPLSLRYNGGTSTSRLGEIVADVRSKFAGRHGIHAHNDCDVAVANTLVAVETAQTHVQGCLNGLR